MATGAYDANGIWNYGEDDNIALFSDLLNLATESTSDAFTDDRARLATLEAGSLSGLIPVAPTSVVAATGTASASTNGTITFTGVTSVTLNNVFTSEYQNYRVIVTFNSFSGATNIRGRLTTGGVELTGTAYNRMALQIKSDSTTTAGGGANGDFFNVLPNGSAANNTGGGFFDITVPFTTSRKTVNGMATGYNGTTYETVSHGALIMDTTARDGIKIYSTTGTATGSVQVLGYND